MTAEDKDDDLIDVTIIKLKKYIQEIKNKLEMIEKGLELIEIRNDID